jgi:hypothetical protein
VKVSELSGALLDYWVARAAGITNANENEIKYPPKVYFGPLDGSKDMELFSPSTNWAHGGPIIERERIMLDGRSRAGNPINYWCARLAPGRLYFGETALVAAMRAYVASKFGEEVPDQPEEK